MTFIQRVTFIHNEFKQICGGNRSEVDANFRNKCSIFLINDENFEQKGSKGSDASKLHIIFPSWDLKWGNMGFN